MPVIASPYENYSIQLTGKLIVIDALDLLGANDVASEPEPEMLKRDMRTLNMMLDSWNTENLVVYARTQFIGTLVSGTQSYVIGPDETFNTFRPVKIEDGEGIIRSSGTDYPLASLSARAWAETSQKSNSGRPCALYYEPGASNGTITFDQNPDAAYTFILFRRQLLSQITNQNQIFYLPPGYAEAITNHLAIRLAPKAGKPVPQEVVEIATNAKANLKRNNMTTEAVRCDDALMGWPSGYVDSRAIYNG